MIVVTRRHEPRQSVNTTAAIVIKNYNKQIKFACFKSHKEHCVRCEHDSTRYSPQPMLYKF